MLYIIYTRDQALNMMYQTINNRTKITLGFLSRKFVEFCLPGSNAFAESKKHELLNTFFGGNTTIYNNWKSAPNFTLPYSEVLKLIWIHCTFRIYDWTFINEIWAFLFEPRLAKTQDLLTPFVRTKTNYICVEERL